MLEYSHTEFGSIEVEVQAITYLNGRTVIIVIDRLSSEKVTCVLTPELVDKLGPLLSKRAAWEGQRLIVTGTLHYNRDGSLKNIYAEDADDLPWTNVSLSDLKDIDILEDRSVGEHLHLLRGDEIG